MYLVSIAQNSPAYNFPASSLENSNSNYPHFLSHALFPFCLCVSSFRSSMATSNSFLNTPTKTPLEKSHSKRHHQSSADSAVTRASRFEAYNRLQAAAVAFGEKLPIPEIVALGGQSDGKSSLLEALLGFRFNVREVEMGTRRPLILQMVHDPTALDPRCRFQVHIIWNFTSFTNLGCLSVR